MKTYINKPIPKFSPMAIDIETSSLDPYQGRLLSVAVSDGEDVWILLDFFGFDGVKEILEDDSIVKIAHNAKFEYKWFLHKLNCHMNNLFDTQLAENTLYKGLPDYLGQFNLASTLARRQGVLLNKDTREQFENHPGFAVRPVTSEQLQYMAEDVLYLNRLMEQQLEDAEKANLGYTINLENIVVPVTSEMELGGMKLDVDLWHEQVVAFEKLVKKYDKLLRESIVADTIDVEYTKGIKTFDSESINFNSTKQLLAVYRQCLNQPIKSTDQKKVLKPALENGSFNERATLFTEALIALRTWKKRLQYDYTRFIHPITGKVHGQYRQDGTDTGRYSMAKPNNQQVPKPTAPDEPNMRHVWIADSEDFVIARADYAQQEPRILAEFCQGTNLHKACNEEDVYRALGKHIYGYEIEKKGEKRHLAKTAMLGKSYGQSAEAFCKTINKPIKEGLEIFNTFNRTFPEIDIFAEKMQSMARQYGYTTTLTGRRRHFDYTKYVKHNEPRNAPIQGTGADMTKLALYKVYTALTELKKDGKIDINTRVWHTVHDEIEVHCHKTEIEQCMAIAIQLMEEAAYEICPNVLHAVEAEYGYRWDK